MATGMIQVNSVPPDCVSRLRDQDIQQQRTCGFIKTSQHEKSTSPPTSKQLGGVQNTNNTDTFSKVISCLGFYLSHVPCQAFSRHEIQFYSTTVQQLKMFICQPCESEFGVQKTDQGSQLMMYKSAGCTQVELLRVEDRMSCDQIFLQESVLRIWSSRI